MLREWLLTNYLVLDSSGKAAQACSFIKVCCCCKDNPTEVASVWNKPCDKVWPNSVCNYSE